MLFFGGNNTHARTQICLMLENINSRKFKTPFTPIAHSPTLELVMLLMLPMLMLPGCGVRGFGQGREENLIMRHERKQLILIYYILHSTIIFPPLINIVVETEVFCCHLLTLITLPRQLTANCLHRCHLAF